MLKTKQKQEAYMTENEDDVVDFYCIWWKREDACRFGNKEEIGNGIFPLYRKCISWGGSVYTHSLVINR